MANLREAVAVTGLASLEWSGERERAIDRVAACGKCSPLGVKLWKARYMLEAKAYQDARGELISLYSARYVRERREIAEKIADQALHEFMSFFCATCNGAKEVMVGELKVTCSACLGSGVKRYSDAERATSMQLSYGLTKRLRHKVGWLLGEMSAIDRLVNSQLNSELERV